MNSFLEYPHLPLPRRYSLMFLGVSGVLYALYAFLFLPLSIIFSSNVVYAGTMLYEIVVVILNGLELLAFCWAFSCAISARFRYGALASVRVVLLFAAAVAFRYIGTFMVSVFLDGLDSSDLLLEIGYFLLYVLLDVTQLTVVLLVMHILQQKRDVQDAVRLGACRAKGIPVPDRLAEAIPGNSIFSIKGAVHAATLVGAGMILFVRMGGRIIYDIGYGAPADGADLAWMVLYYATDIAISVLCCAVIRALCVRILRRQEIK